MTRTSIEIMWAAPSPGSFNGHLMGYKVSSLLLPRVVIYFSVV